MADDFDWSGFYVGANGQFAPGGIGHIFEFSGAQFPHRTTNIDHSFGEHESGLGGGLQAGYLWPVAHRFFGGFEVEAAALRTGSFSTGALLEQDAPTLILQRLHNVRVATSIDGYGSVTARMGLSEGRMLLYAAAGIAVARVSTVVLYRGYTYNYLNSSVASHEGGKARRSTVVSWAGALGLEYAITDALAIRGEYGILDLGNQSVSIADGFSVDVGRYAHLVKLGFNLRF